MQIRVIGENSSMEVKRLCSLSAYKPFEEESCVICEQIKPKGIHLCALFICTECERELIQTETNHPKYKYFLKQLKKVSGPEIYL